jgi:broad specificity phosphatase PhoE
MSENESSNHGRSVKLWLIRHGQASFGKEDYDCLSELGIKQSRILGEHFAKTGLQFNAVYSGQMKRQIDTAELVIDKLPSPFFSVPQILSEFNEYDFISIIQEQLPEIREELNLPENILHTIQADQKSFQKLFNIIYSRWVSGTHRSLNTESYKRYIARIKEGVFKVVQNSQPGENVGIFTSGGVVNAVMQMALDLPDNVATELGWRIRNTSVSLFTANTGQASEHDSPFKCKLMTFNSTAHLDLTGTPELATYR